MGKLFLRVGIVALLLGFLLPPVADAAILRNLKLGDRGEDVRELQTVLNRSSDTRIALIGPGSSGNETAYFGILTKVAVIKFQEKYADQILKPIGLTSGTGFVGGQTRLLLLQIAGGQVSLLAPVPAPASESAKTAPPKIASILPAVVTKSTTELIITGENFTPANNTVIVSSEAPGSFTGLPSLDGKTIKFQFRFSSADLLKKQFAPFIASGRYAAVASSFTQNIQERVSPTGNAQIPVRVGVRNANGESATAQMLIDLTEILKEIGQPTY